MSETQRQSPTTGYADVQATERETTGWVGWILFAAMMLILVGSFQAIAGFVALFNNDYYAVASRNLAVHVSYTGWGWAHIVLGLLAVGGGFGLMVGQTWARIYAVIYAGIAAVVNLAFINAAPVWATIFITIDVLVIWAVTVHGRELKNAVSSSSY